ncbi:KAP family P-loop NTPase fold protein [Maridesulfovibrio sp.]|uniref:KAP family P-loop NTPase fold protein n=1 Tax=Maridesulfovibrio sp. TaxID=2795000 RepID=UPI003BAD2721
MFYRPPEFIIDPDDPFANDKLKREPHIKNLTKLMKNSETPLVMTVSASWGSGKTSFIKMWEAYLRLDDGGGHSCIRFDAWQHDFNKEPLLAIMGELGEFINDNKSRFEKIKDSFDRAVAELPDLLQAMAGILTIASFANPFATAPAIACATLGNATGKIKNYAKKGHSTLKKQLEDFKKNIQAVIDTITNNGKTPLYFFVDELDRCEPHYAIKLLEALKHFFDLNGIIFVLAIDRERLAGIVEKRYGKGVDDLGYLKRFVDINYTIPEPPYEEFIEYVAFDTLKLDQHPITKGDMKDYFLDASVMLAEELDMKARDIEKIFMRGYPILIKNFDISNEFNFDEQDKEILTKDKAIFYTKNQYYIDKLLYKSICNYFITPLTVLFLCEKGFTSLKKLNECPTIENKAFVHLNLIRGETTNSSYNINKWPKSTNRTSPENASTPSHADELISKSIANHKNKIKFINFIFESIKHYSSRHIEDLSSIENNTNPNFYADIDFSYFDLDPRKNP